MTNPYETLGVARTATAEEIKSAYRKKAKEYHPDLHPDDPHATDKMNEVNQAYEILSDADKRAMYDAGYTGSQGRPSQQSSYNPYGNPYGNRYQYNQGEYNSYSRGSSKPDSSGSRSSLLGPTGRRILRFVGLIILWRVVGRFLPFWFFFF